MHKVDGQGVAPGNRFTLGDADNGVPSTQITADFMNAVMDEITTVIVSAGFDLDKADNTQLLAAIQHYISEGSVAFEDKPQGVVFAGPINGEDAPPAFRKLEVSDLPIFLPAGMITAYGGTTAPAGWLLCNGQAYSRASYSTLFSVIGTVCGAGDSSTTFNVPDLRGRFIRGWDAGTGRDPNAAGRTAMQGGGATGNNIGSIQGDELREHVHPYDLHKAFDASGNPGGNRIGIGTTSLMPNQSGGIKPAGGAETRPLNAYVNFIIKT